ncbi:MAG TPA: TauD/TfdA family dioxygenase [Gemmatimonadales bacterium]
MTTSSAAGVPGVEIQPGRSPILYADAIADPEALRAFVAEHGSLYVRGLDLQSPGQVEATFRSFGALVTEREAFAPRKEYAQGVYSASQWPPNQPMCMHHELSYVLEPPSLMLFACLTAPLANGATTLADAATILDALPIDLVDRFDRVGWQLVRTYNEDIGASLPEAFGTSDHRIIESYCRAHAIDFEWRDGVLHTRQLRNAIVRHPVTGRRCWFNQIAFLNEWTLAPEVREYLVDVYGEDGLPFNTRFGDGEPIGPDVVQQINAAYEANTRREPWQPGDLLLVDNVRTAHAREPFEGTRELVVAMADPVRLITS